MKNLRPAPPHRHHTFEKTCLSQGKDQWRSAKLDRLSPSTLPRLGASSSSSTSRWNYDVFLSFRGEDTREVFYNVDPSEIRNQKGNFGIALANHEKKFKNNKNKVQGWRDALRKAANASGWHYKKGCATYKSESDFIQNIVEEIANAKVNRTQLYVAEYPVGINSLVEAIESLLDIGLDEFCVVGIHGLPGVGKTTITKAVYNIIANCFDGSCFLENVRENLGTDAGIIKLQEQLLNDILGNGNWRVGSRFRGISLLTGIVGVEVTGRPQISFCLGSSHLNGL
uniref:TIR domain-containing protein n=1 Tax=Quercus lobata TaxID=97700 RepID=A0A7N2LBH6_QUELO